MVVNGYQHALTQITPGLQGSRAESRMETLPIFNSYEKGCARQPIDSLDLPLLRELRY
jgi:hypothetical protein